MLDEIAGKWDSMTETERSALSSSMAGTNQINEFKTLIAQYDKVQEYIKTAQSASGEAVSKYSQYQTSLSGKLESFNNSLQSLSTTIVNSDLFGSMIDGATNFLSVLDSIISSVGSLNLLLGVAGSKFMTSNNLGILNYDKDEDKFSFGNLFKGFKSSKVKKELSKEVQDLFSGFNLEDSFLDQIDDLGDSFNNISDKGLKSYVSALKDAGNTSVTAGQALTTLQNNASTTSSVFTKLATVGKTALSALANFGITLLASLAIDFVITQIDNAIHKTERLIEAGNEARDSISSIESERDTQRTTTEENASRYAELSQGVNTRTNQNISLTTDEYSEYLSVCNEIASVYPSVVSSYDSQGNAILNLGSNADEATQKLTDLLDASEQVSNTQIRENLVDATKGTLAELNEAQRELNKIQDQVDYLESSATSDATDDVINKLRSTMQKRSGNTALKFDADTNIEQVNMLETLLNKNGISETSISTKEDGSIVLRYLGLPSNDLIDSVLSQWQQEVNDSVNSTIENSSVDIANNKQALNEASQNVESIYNQLTQDALTSLKSSQAFNDMPEAFQEMLINSVSNIDWTTVEDKFDDDFNINDFVDDTFLQKYNIMSNNGMIEKALQNYFDVSAITDLPINEYRQQLAEAAGKILDAMQSTGYSNDDVAAIWDAIGYTIEDESGNTVESIQNAYNNVASAMQEANSEFTTEDLDALTYTQLIDIEARIENNEAVDEAIQSVIDESKAAVEEASSTEPATLTSVLESVVEADSDDKLSETISTLTSDIDSLSSSLSSLANGDYTSDDLTELLQTYPELAGQTDNLNSAISSLQVDKVKEFAATWKDAISVLSGDELEAASEMFSQAIANLDLSGMDSSTLRESLGDLIDSSFANVGDQALSNIKNLFANSNLSDTELQAWIKVMLDPSNAEKSYADLVDEVENTKIEINVQQSEKNLSSLQKTMDELESSATQVEDRMSMNEAKGLSNTVADYQELVQNSNLQIKNLQQQNSELQTQKAYLESLGYDYSDVQSQIDSNVSAINSARQSQIEWNEAARELKNAEGEGLSAYNTATSSRNAGDNYLDILSGYETQKENREAGLVGTDDFKTYTAMIDQFGRTTADAFDEASAKMERYFTEDATGVQNALTDLSTKTNEAGEALATYNESMGEWSYNIDDIQGSADALGISFEAMLAIMGRLQDYGFTNDFFTSVEEGQQHLGDLYSDLTQAETTLQQLKEAQANGDESVTNEMIESQQAQVDSIRQSIVDTQSLIEQLQTRSVQDIEAETQSARDIAQSYIDSLGEISDESARQVVMDKLQSLNDEYHLGLEFEVDESGLVHLKGEVEELESEDGTIEVDADTSNAVSKIQEAKEYLDIVNGTNASATISVDEAGSKVDEIVNELAQLDQQTLIEIGFTASTGDMITAEDIKEQIGTVAVDVQANVTTDTSQTSGTTGTSTQEVTVNYTKGEQEEPDDKNASVNYDKGKQVSPDDKTANVNYTLGDQVSPVTKSAAVSYDKIAYQIAPLDRTAKVTYVSTNSSAAGQATGTFSNSKAGTVYSLWSDYRHSIGAYANGTDGRGRLLKDETALVNELGMESRVSRNGVWELIPGGAHFEQLQRGK